MTQANLKSLLDNSELKTVDVYVDGACSGNPGPGGWGALFLINGEEASLFGSDIQTTNNKMELQAAIEAIKILPAHVQVVMYTDSQYVKNGITSWIHGWKKKDWHNSKGEPVKNKEQWVELDALASQYTIEWKWVRGHDGNIYNEKADMLAKRGVIAIQMR